MKIDAKTMEEKLKIGWTPEDFAHHLNISEDEFMNLLQKTFKNYAFRDFKSRLLKNQKRKNKFQKKCKERKPITMSRTEITSENYRPCVDDESEDNSSSVALVLKDLKDKEETLQKSICENEISLNGLLTKKRELTICLKDKQALLQQLQATVAKHEEELNSIISQFNEIDNSLAELNADTSLKREQLSTIQADIKSLEKVEIYVYDDKIECENSEATIPESWTEMFSQLIEDEVVESLTVKQTKQLAKLISFTSFFHEQNREFEIVFDNEELKKVYEIMP